MANKKLKLLYLARFLQRETDEQHPKTVQDMIRYLADCDIPAERKSIYDDLHLLELYGMDIQTDKSKHFGYFLGERDFQLPELKMLIDVVQASPFLTQRKSMELIGKLEHLASRYEASEIRRQVYVMHRVRTNNETLYYTVDGISTAINKNRQVAFRYFDWTADGGKAYRRDGQEYVINPVALCVDRYYYLVAYDSETATYRHYRLDRMSGLHMLDTPRPPLPEHFDLGEYTKTIFDMFNGETVSVRLELDKTLLNAAVDRFGSDAMFHDSGDGKLQLTAPVELGPTFFGWLFQFSDHIRLLAPQSAVDRFTDWCRKVLTCYEAKEREQK